MDSILFVACENALRCIGNNDVQKLGRSVFPENLKATTISEITRLRNVAKTSITSRSVVDERTIQMPVSLQQETDTLLQWSDTKVEKAGERIFRVGSVRYIMDPSRRTLQRISDDESLSSASINLVCSCCFIF
ncbi:unnamed protein product [Trifolium pratense]|uniref:Uncharacterized protein n=1 Tax=Trifolium pratense TaxID=57577 RepID=A0ACB0M2S6_TRIPR|nr:unnamed protein product [Trifolium pratense]